VRDRPKQLHERQGVADRLAFRNGRDERLGGGLTQPQRSSQKADQHASHFSSWLAHLTRYRSARQKPVDEDPILAKSPNTSPIATQPPSLRDDDVTRAVRSELEQDGGVVATAIQVSTNAGVVELTGKTADLLSKERATRLAQAVRGVIAVSNRVEVQPAVVADEQLAAHVQNALVFNPTTDSLDMTTEAKAGVVTLSGKVNSWVEKDAAERVAKGIRGVREVRNELAVGYTGKRSDAEIDSEVVSRLRWDALVNDGLLKVRVEDGTVKLSGFVGSAAERERAVRLAASVPGARHADTNGLAVRWWAKDEDLRSAASAKPTDREIHDAIK
jgi:osmotically-inducible protein OsmY